MTRRMRITLAVAGLVGLLGLVVLFLAAGLAGPRGWALYSTPIRVVGTVVDRETGEPVAGATVFVLRGNTREAAERDLARLLEFAAEYPNESGNYDVFGARLTTGEDGTFDVTLMLTACCATGPGIERTSPPPRLGAGMLLVQREGYERSFFPTEAGTWTVLEQEGVYDPYGLVDAQVLRLPPVK